MSEITSHPDAEGADIFIPEADSAPENTVDSTVEVAETISQEAKTGRTLLEQAGYTRRPIPLLRF